MSTATQPQLSFESFNYRNGDPVLFEFEEGIIQDIDPVNKGASFKLPYGTMGFNTSYKVNRVWPVTPEGKEFAAFYSKLYSDLREAAGGTNINWPGIKDYASQLFNKTMTNLHTGNTTELGHTLMDATEFFLAINRQMEHARSMSAFGVPIFRR